MTETKNTTTNIIRQQEYTEFNPEIHYLGVLCKRGHDYDGTGKSLRNKKSDRCSECSKALSKAYHEANKDKAKTYNKAYNKANKDDIKATKKIYQEVNKDNIKIKRQTHYRANKDKISAEKKVYHEANKGKIRARKKAYRKANKHKITARARAYSEANKHKINASRKAYREANEHKVTARARAYYEANKGKIRAASKTYRESTAKYVTNKSNLLGIEKIRQSKNSNGDIEVKCAYCGVWFTPTNSQIRSRITAINNTGGARLYCSDNCKMACPTYNQNMYPKGFKKATSREVNPLLRQLCFERDEYTCQRCGATIKEAQLHCHHIEGATQNPLLSNDLTNVVTFCKSCHKAVHKMPGCTTYDYRCPVSEEITA